MYMPLALARFAEACLERLPEEVRLEENRPCIDTRFSEHGEETVVFLLVETDGVPVHRRIKFGISP